MASDLYGYQILEILERQLLIQQKRQWYPEDLYYQIATAHVGVIAQRLEPPPLYTPDEVEAITAFGADRYAKQAMVCDEERRVRAEREYRRALGPIVGWCTDSDTNALTARDWNEIRLSELAFLRSLTPALPRESPGDWAARNGVTPRKLWRGAEALWDRLMSHLMERARTGFYIDLPDEDFVCLIP